MCNIIPAVSPSVTLPAVPFSPADALPPGRMQRLSEREAESLGLPGKTVILDGGGSHRAVWENADVSILHLIFANTDVSSPLSRNCNPQGRAERLAGRAEGFPFQVARTELTFENADVSSFYAFSAECKPDQVEGRLVGVVLVDRCYR